MRRSRGPSDSSRATSEPSAPPINMVGPSRPPEPPVPSVQIEASVLMPSSRGGNVPPWWKARIMVSPPPPRASGALRVSQPQASPPSAGRMSSSQGRKVCGTGAAAKVSPLARRTEYPARSSSRIRCVYSSDAEEGRPREPTDHPDGRRLQQRASDEPQVQRRGVGEQRGQDGAVALDPPRPEAPEALPHPLAIP